MSDHAVTDPKAPEEWQEAVDAASAMQALDSAQKYGFVSGGPDVNIERCEEILSRGRELGFEPAVDAVERFVREAVR